jgi:hypothetical protein
MSNVTFSGGIPSSAVVTDASGTIVAENERNKYIFVRNMSQTETLWLSFGTSAAEVGKGVPLLPMEFYEFGTTVFPSAGIQAVAPTGKTISVSIFIGR